MSDIDVRSNSIRLTSNTGSVASFSRLTPGRRCRYPSISSPRHGAAPRSRAAAWPNVVAQGRRGRWRPRSHDAAPRERRHEGGSATTTRRRRRRCSKASTAFQFSVVPAPAIPPRSKPAGGANGHHHRHRTPTVWLTPFDGVERNSCVKIPYLKVRSNEVARHEPGALFDGAKGLEGPRYPDAGAGKGAVAGQRDKTSSRAKWPPLVVSTFTTRTNPNLA